MSSKSTTYRFKQHGDYAEFIVRSKGVDEWPELTLELECSYKQDFIEELKDELPIGSRVWDKDNRVWRLLPRYQELAIKIALRHYPFVWLVEGTEVRDLKTGISQGGLFA